MAICWRRGRREVSLGKKEEEQEETVVFGGLSGEAQCECVFMWENINELLPTGRGAVPIIFSWENTRRKTERQKKREGEMKEDQILPFCSHWFITEWGFVSQQFVRKQQQRLFGFITVMERDNVLTHTDTPSTPTEVSLSNTMIPTSTELVASDLRELCVGGKTEH